ncbi:hypothetical protein LSH36_784g01037 [Paralvinella palmiformis]|uniref:IgGFc-binding protein N-terminal domain-containing protein n=1 Tax=Paralvinella palmiformis TaxID=53620 RepID=A0AAD9MUA9_9ANNE|nr:hypothetical protein LSH36_784g01037 [Paralvinella palmiformis]
MLLFLLTCFINASGGTNIGTRFVFNVISDVRCTSEVILSVTPLEPVDVDVSVRLPRMSDVEVVKATAYFGYWTNITLPSAVRVTQPAVNEKGIEVIATSPISLYMTECPQCGGRTTKILSTDELGTHYVVSSVRNSSTHIVSAVSLTAIGHHTQVTVTLVAVNSTSQISFDGVIYQAGETLHVELNCFQSLLLQYEPDESRIDIKSSSIVSVFIAEGINIGITVPKVAEHPPVVGAGPIIHQLVPVSKWGQDFLSFPFSQRGDNVHITAAENSTRISLSRRTSTTHLNVSTYLPINVHLPMGDFIYILSDKPLMVLQYVDDDCAMTSNRLEESCSTSNILMLPSVKTASHRYVLRPLIRDEGAPVEVNMMVKQGDDIRLNNETLSSAHKNVFNMTLYGISGDFNLYKLHLLASSGTMERNSDRFLLVTSTSAFIHTPTQGNLPPAKQPDLSPDNGTDSEQTGIPYQERPVQLVSSPVAEARAHLSLDTASSLANTSDATTEKSATSAYPPHRDHPQIQKIYNKNRLNDIYKPLKINLGPHYRRLPSPLQPTGVPFVVKSAKARKEVNFHEAESRSVSRDSDDDAPGLDITVIAVIVSLASAVILAFVFVFGFLMAEFLCRRNLFSLSRVSPYIE